MFKVNPFDLKTMASCQLDRDMQMRAYLVVLFCLSLLGKRESSCPSEKVMGTVGRNFDSQIHKFTDVKAFLCAAIYSNSSQEVTSTT